MLAVIITLLFPPKCVALYAVAMASFAKCLKHVAESDRPAVSLNQALQQIPARQGGGGWGHLKCTKLT